MDVSDRICLQGFFFFLAQLGHAVKGTALARTEQRGVFFSGSKRHLLKTTQTSLLVAPVPKKQKKNLTSLESAGEEPRKKCAPLLCNIGLYLIERYLIELVGSARSLHQSWTAIRSQCKPAVGRAAASFQGVCGQSITADI